MSKWTLTSDSLPEECEDVLVFIERDAWRGNKRIRIKEIEIGWYCDGKWHCDGCSGVIGLAWMPLPKEPRIRKPVNKDA